MFLLVDRLFGFFHKIHFKMEAKTGKNVRVLGCVHFLNSNVSVGDNCILYPNVSFEGDGLITIGNNVKIGTNTIINANSKGGITIGDNTIIAANSYIIDCVHGTSSGTLIQSQELIAHPIHIGQDVWIAANAVIAKGAELKDGCVIGANSYVDRVIEKNGIAFGCPARIKSHRLPTDVKF